MKLKKVAGTKKSSGGYYPKYIITSVSKEIVEKSDLLDKPLKAKAVKGKIIIEKA